MKEIFRRQLKQVRAEFAAKPVTLVVRTDDDGGEVGLSMAAAATGGQAEEVHVDEGENDVRNIADSSFLGEGQETRVESQTTKRRGPRRMGDSP